MKSKFKKLMAAALVLCLMLALLPAGVLAEGQYSIKLEFDSEFGTVTVDKSTANGSDNVTITSVPIVGHYTASVKYYTDEKPQGEPAVRVNGTYDYQFTMPESDVTVTVSYRETDTESITIVENENCTITTDPAEKAYPDQTVEIIVSDLKSGYSVDKYSVITNDGMEGTVTVNSDGTFIMPQAPVKVSVTLKYTAPVTYSVTSEVKGTGGQISTAQLSYEVGSNVQVSVNPDEDYHLKSLMMSKTDGSDPQPIGGSYTFEMPAYDVKLVAEFELKSEPVPEKYAVNTAAPQNGTLSVDKTEAAEGDTVKVTANAANGYVLDSLYYIDNNNKPVNISTDTMSFEMPASAVTVHAWFREVSLTHDVQVSYSTGGTVTASPNTDVATGTPVTLTVTPAEGYWLKSLKIDGVEFANYVDWSYFWYYKYGTVSFTMTDADVSVYAEFTDQLYVFTNYNGYRGEVEVLVKDDASGEWVDTNFADTDDWVAFKPVAYTNFNIGAISVTGNWTGRSYDVETWYWHNGWYYFQMPWENVTINVEFTDNSHAVNVKDASNGTLKANTKWAVEDERVYITAVPDKGYELTWLSVKAEDGTKIDVYEALKEDTYYFFMPDLAVTVSAIFAYDYPDMPFTDVNSNSWYFNAVEFVYNKGIMQGVSSTKFSPNGTVTRGMLVTMLWRMAGEPYVGGGSFDDVASGSYYATAVAWAAKNGIVDGYNSTRFGPNDAVTREQIATMLYRYAKWLGYSTSGSSLAGYSDASSVSSWAKDAMGWAVKNSVVTGVTATKLNPASSATRAETAQMFMNFYEYLN